MALQDYRNDMLRCTRCSVCKFIPLSSVIKSWRFAYGCPGITRYNFHSYSGGGKLITALSLIDGRIDYSDRLLDVVYKCTLCGSCDLSCRLGTDMEVMEILHELRVKCFEDGNVFPSHKAIIDSIRNYDNVWMQPRTRRGVWAKGLEVKDLSKEGVKADALYYAGCTYDFDPDLQRVARNTITLLKMGGVDIGILGNKEKCCCSPAYMVGDMKIFKEYARDNIRVFNELGVKQVITSCAGCYGLFKTKYPLVGEEMNFSVVHAVELIDQLIKENKIKPTKRVSMDVAYHDPCHLGRLSEPRIPSGGKETKVLGSLFIKDVPKVMGLEGVFDPPRDVIKSIPGLNLVEMERVREYSWCCGSGAGVKSQYPDFALWTGEERIEEARAAGAEALVSACSWCEKNLLDAAAAGGDKIKVYDFTDLLMESI